MKKQPLPQRKIIRLQHYDYSENGLYFMTICVQDRLCLLGHILNAKMELSAAGKMIEECYLELEQYFPTVKCLDYVIMPNHIHFILHFENKENLVRYSLFEVIQRFKSRTNVEYIKNVKQNNWQPFNKKLWQRSYYEHIVRDEKDYLMIAEYIDNNP
ncbi:transposase [Actinobacillus vicugnae]|uniref:transposase n=1 Tax=Actinobacillus vicugnae TaxID=2573093 RepID=UPI00123FA05E|nr:transposase [Actinobacillus vicugnae]